MNIDRECTDVNLVVRQYKASLSSLLDKHAPSKRYYILVLKAIRRKYESLWRKTRLTVHFDMYSGSCMDVKRQLVRVNLRYCKRKYQAAMVIRKKNQFTMLLISFNGFYYANKLCTTTLYHFDRVTDPELIKIISGMNKITCSSDPFPTRLLMSHLHAIIPILQHIVNLCLTTGDFPISCKSSID